MQATLEDVARRAKCSPATVSRVVNRVGQVSDAMRRRVMRAAQKSGYPLQSESPSQLPVHFPGERHSKSSATGYIEIILYRHSPFEPVSLEGGQLEVRALRPTSAEAALSDEYRLSNSFQRSLVEGMADEVSRWGRQAILKPNSSLLRGEFLEEVNASDKAGVLLSGEYSTDVDAFVAACRKPLVLVDLHSDAGPPVVTMDSARGIGAAFDHLMELGHRRIGFAGGPPEVAERTGRHPAYRWKMAAAGFPVRRDWVFVESPHMIHIGEWARATLARTDRPTAILCQNDFIALAIVQAARELNLDVPGDLSVVGFDDIEVAALVNPPLTSVRVPTGNMGRLAVQELMLQIASQHRSRPMAQRVCVMPKLIVRNSTGPCRK